MNITLAVELLDVKVPGWFRRINLGTFTITCYLDCILAQLFPGFNAGLDALGITDDEEIKDMFGNRTFSYRAASELQAAWIKEIQLRLDSNVDP